MDLSTQRIVHEIDLKELYDKPLNFLLGSGASVGHVPTLALKRMNVAGESYTIETLIEELEDAGRSTEVMAVYLYYYCKCIQPAYDGTDEKSLKVIENYRQFLQTAISMMLRRSAHHGQQCNIFTTNYDRCIATAADSIVSQSHADFVLNDGTRGIYKRVVQAQNFHNCVRRHSIFGQHSTPIPQVNLIHMHGSICWSVECPNTITAAYGAKSDIVISDELNDVVERLNKLLNNTGSENQIVNEISTICENHDEKLKEFYEKYEKLPLVSPTKRKFKQTVLEEHYYQMLRFMSYELERPNAIMVSFGFSFADEHILSLVKRCLANKSLVMFVCCFNESEYSRLSKEFQLYLNVKFVKMDDKKEDKKELNFDEFNGNAFSLQKYVESKSSFENEACNDTQGLNGE